MGAQDELDKAKERIAKLEKESAEQKAEIADLKGKLASAEAAHAELLAAPAPAPSIAPTERVWIVLDEVTFPNGLSTQEVEGGKLMDFKRASHDIAVEFTAETVKGLQSMFGDKVTIVTPERAKEINDAFAKAAEEKRLHPPKSTDKPLGKK